MNDTFCILSKISLILVSRGQIDNNTTWVYIMARHRIGNRSLSEPMLTRFIDACMRHQGEMSRAHPIIITYMVCCANTETVWLITNNIHTKIRTIMFSCYSHRRASCGLGNLSSDISIWYWHSRSPLEGHSQITFSSFHMVQLETLAKGDTNIFKYKFSYTSWRSLVSASLIIDNLCGYWQSSLGFIPFKQT